MNMVHEEAGLYGKDTLLIWRIFQILIAEMISNLFEQEMT